jgi:hypothetical protein
MAERERARANAERRAWDEFRPKLAALQTFVEAQRLARSPLSPGSPGRKFYSNLGFFLHAFIVPLGSSYEEKSLYIEFIRRLDAAKSLKAALQRKLKRIYVRQ